VRAGTIADVTISTLWPDGPLDTVTLYINPEKQKAFYVPILQLKPNRVIFNPGTENAAFQRMLTDAGIHVEVACTLVMLSIGNY
jgi:hypothetical protein